MKTVTTTAELVKLAGDKHQEVLFFESIDIELPVNRDLVTLLSVIIVMSHDLGVCVIERSLTLRTILDKLATKAHQELFDAIQDEL